MVWEGRGAKYDYIPQRGVQESLSKTLNYPLTAHQLGEAGTESPDDVGFKPNQLSIIFLAIVLSITILINGIIEKHFIFLNQ